MKPIFKVEMSELLSLIYEQVADYEAALRFSRIDSTIEADAVVSRLEKSIAQSILFFMSNDYETQRTISGRNLDLRKYFIPGVSIQIPKEVWADGTEPLDELNDYVPAPEQTWYNREKFIEHLNENATNQEREEYYKALINRRNEVDEAIIEQIRIMPNMMRVALGEDMLDEVSDPTDKLVEEFVSNRLVKFATTKAGITGKGWAGTDDDQITTQPLKGIPIPDREPKDTLNN